MAEVWSAEHQLLRVKVALKILFRGMPILHTRLLREGRAQAAMDHPNILPVRDVIDIDGSPGLVLPLIEGPSLGELLVRYRPDEAEALALFHDIVSGVQHAHEHGLVHRDLKPGNVLMDLRRGRVVPRISDFGMVKDTAGPATTRAGVAMGTLQYAAPEQLLDAASADHRADLFSLGVLLVELLTGRLPFFGDSLKTQLSALSRGPDLQGVPAVWVPLCEALLQTAPEHRPQSCGQILEGLARHRVPATLDPLGEASRLGQAVRFGTPQPQPGQTLLPQGTTDAGALPETWAASLTADGRHNLPSALDTFVGRTDDLRRLDVLLERARLVTVLGTGGIGKTRMVLEYARQHRGRYPGGVYFCDLREADSDDDLAFVVARALQLTRNQDDFFGQIGRALEGRGRCLVILDNFEQLVGHAAMIAPWVQHAAASRFVVTSRTVLGAHGEQILNLESLREADALALFERRAQQARPRFALTAANRDAVTTLLAQLDHLPLAIELAAARTRMMSPPAMLRRMSDRFRLLRAGQRGQVTLRAVIDGSWELLADWEKAAFIQCSIFEGRFTLEAAEAILDLSDYTDADGAVPWPIDALQSLLDRSLLRAFPESAYNEPRFGMLQSLNAYATEKRNTLPAAVGDDLARRHIAFYEGLGTLAARETSFTERGLRQWRAASDNIGNLEVALQRAQALGLLDAAARLLLAVLEIRTHHSQIPAALFTQAESIAAALGRDGPSPVQIDLWCTISQIQVRRGRYAEARPRILETLTSTRSLNNRVFEVICLGDLGHIDRSQGRLSDAQQRFEDALQIARAIDYYKMQCMCLVNLGIVARNQGRPDQARTHYTAALALARSLNHPRFEAACLGSLGYLHWLAGRVQEAEQHCTTALVLSRQIGDRQNEGIWLGNLGHLLAEQGRLDEATARAEEALQIARELGDRRSQTLWWGNLAEFALKRNEPDAALEHLDRALQIAREIDDHRHEGIWLRVLGEVHASRGDFSASEAAFQEGAAVLSDVGDQMSLGELLHAHARAALRSGKRDQARMALRDATQIAEQMNLPTTARLTQDLAALREALARYG